MLGALFVVSALLPAAALASDLGGFVYDLSSGTMTSLSGTSAGRLFLSEPTTQNLANLTQQQITGIMTDLSYAGTISSLPSDTFSSFITPTQITTLTSTLGSLSTEVLQSFSSDTFSTLTSGTVSSLLTSFANGTLSQTVASALSGSLLTGLTPATLSTAISGLLPTDLQRLPGVLLSGVNTDTLTTVFNSFNVADLANIIPNLPTTFLSSFQTGDLSTMLSGLNPSVLQSFLPAQWNVLPTGTISDIISNVSGGTLTSLASSLLTGQSAGSLVSIFSSVAPGILGSLPTSLTSLISPSTMSTLLSGGVGGLSSSIISSLGGSLLGGFSAGNLTSLFTSLAGGSTVSAATAALNIANSALGTAAGSLLSSVGGSVLSSAVGGVVGGLAGPIGSALTSVIPAGMLGGITGFAGFGLFVPVFDVALVPAFSAYSSAFNAYAANMNGIIAANPDSLRNIIAGGNPQGEQCHERDANDKVWAYRDGPWAWAYASATPVGELPATIPKESGLVPGNQPSEYVQIIGQGQGGSAGVGNDSGSIRCILTALVGYQKIALYVQIQSLLKQYIADAQQQLLSNKLLNTINAANLNWAREGNKTIVNNIQSSEPVYVLNSIQSQYNRNARTAEMVVAQAAAQKNDKVGSLELCNPLETATAVAINLRDDTEDLRNFVTESTKCSLNATDGGPFTGSDPNAAFDNYMQDANTPDGQGAVYTLEHMLNNPQDTPIGAAMIVQGEADRRLAQSEERNKARAANPGPLPTIKCSGLDSDPLCDDYYTTDVSTAAQNQATVVGAIESGKEQIATSESLDETESPAGERLSTEANTQPDGVYGYDATPLASQNPPTNKLIQELYDTIQYAYFDLNGDQEEWASAALLSIYDTMKFSPTGPTSAIPEKNAEDPSKTYYVDWR